MFHFHILGRADVGARSDDEIPAKTASFKSDPVHQVMTAEVEHGMWLTPLGAILNEDSQVHLVLFATSQTPSHPGDTLEMARMLKEGGIDALAKQMNCSSPPCCDVRTVTTMSMAAWVDAARTAIRDLDLGPDDEIVLDIGPGAGRAFNGLLIGLLQVGILPRILIVNRPVAESVELVDFMRTFVSLEQWLIRSRYFGAAAEVVNDPETKRRLREISEFEDLRRAGNPQMRHVYQMSSLLGDFVRRDQLWAVKVVRLIEEISLRLLSSLGTEAKREIDEYLRTAEGEPLHEHGSVEARIIEAARYDDARWRECPHLPAQLRHFWDGENDHVRGARRIRSAFTRYGHVVRDHANDMQRRVHDRARILAMAPLCGENLDAVTKRVSEMSVGLPATIRDREVTLVVRLVGHSESAGMRSAVERRFVPQDSRFLNLSSSGDPNDVGELTRNFCEQIFDEVKRTEEGGASVVEIAVVLNQGTKAMNLSLLCAASAQVFNLSTRFRVYDLSEGRSGDESETVEVGSIDATLLAGILVPTQSIKQAVREGVKRLDFTLLVRLAHLVRDADELKANIAELELASMGTTMSDVMAVCRLLIDRRDSIGDSDCVMKVSQLLSSGYAEDEEDAWKKERNLKSLWEARTNFVHVRVDDTGRLRLPEWPRGLDWNQVVDGIRSRPPAKQPWEIWSRDVHGRADDLLKRLEYIEKWCESEK